MSSKPLASIRDFFMDAARTHKVVSAEELFSKFKYYKAHSEEIEQGYDVAPFEPEMEIVLTKKQQEILQKMMVSASYEWVQPLPADIEPKIVNELGEQFSSGIALATLFTLHARNPQYDEQAARAFIYAFDKCADHSEKVKQGVLVSPKDPSKFI